MLLPHNEQSKLHEANGRNRLLAVTSPTAALIEHDDFMNLLDKYGAQDVGYSVVVHGPAVTRVQ